MKMMAFGGGTNSFAMLVGLYERGETVDLILFADTGAEKPHTYRAVQEANEYCKTHGFPEIQTVARHTTVSKFERIGTYTTLEEDCLAKGVLPSISYGRKGCSMKYKIEPQNKYANSHPDCLKAWAAGDKVIKLIGYDMDEPHRAQIPEDDKYTYRYPLIEWNWDRDECVEAIKRGGLSQPGKSACYFCGSSTKPEIIELQIRYPDLAARAMEMEKRFLENDTRPCKKCGGIATPNDAPIDSLCEHCGGLGIIKSTVQGLGRNFSWTAFLKADAAQQKLFPEPIITECGSCYDGIHIS